MKRSISAMILLIAMFYMMLQPVTGMATMTSTAEVLRSRVEAFKSAGSLQISGEELSAQDLIPEIYSRLNFRPLWVNAGQVEQLLTVFRNMDKEGLTPDDYHLQALERLQAEFVGGYDSVAVNLRVDRDLLLTDALIRLCYHLSLGKVDPVKLDSNWNFSREMGVHDPAAVLIDAVENGQVDNLLDKVRPGYPAYANLVKALARYRQIEMAGGWPEVPSGPTLRQEDQNERVMVLRQRLIVTGELAIAGQDSPRFDQELVAAVQSFQRHHGLDDDGVVGSATLQALNVDIGQRIDQLRVNLERARWVLHNLQGRFVMVDIAGFEVVYFEDGQVRWSARAQVGRAYRKTPVFKSRITYLEFNPTWTVPPTILKQDVLPAIRKDHGYLASNNMQVLTFKGQPVDPQSIDWQLYPQQSFPYMLRQNPGPSNALGRVKFMFPNEFMVYLHDTPSKSLFSRTSRAFSSGCIRIERPFELVKLLMGDADQWNDQKIQGILDDGKTQRVNLPQPVTVMLMYWTVQVEDVDMVVFKPDIYERDGAILKGLDRWL